MFGADQMFCCNQTSKCCLRPYGAAWLVCINQTNPPTATLQSWFWQLAGGRGFVCRWFSLPGGTAGGGMWGRSHRSPGLRGEREGRWRGHFLPAAWKCFVNVTVRCCCCCRRRPRAAWLVCGSSVCWARKRKKKPQPQSHVLTWGCVSLCVCVSNCARQLS